jgi:two-component system NtrC family sensor kinase
MNMYPGRVLVVDDELWIQSVCRAALEKMGFVVETCSDGTTALEILSSLHPPDLLLLDLHIPGLEGIEVLRKAQQSGHLVTVIVMTGYASLESTAEATLLGAQAILLKPFTPQELQMVVEEVFRKRNADRDAAQLAALHPLIGMSERLLGQLELPRLYEQIVGTAVDALHADRALLVLTHGDERLEAVAHVAVDGVDDAVSVWHEQVAEWVIKRPLPLLLDVDTVLPNELIEVAPARQSQSLLCVPLIARHKVVGVLLAEKLHAKHAFTTAHQEQLVLLASLGAIALENAQLHTSVARSEARYRALLEHAQDVVLLLDKDATAILEVNAAAVTVSGYTREQLLDLSPRRLFSQLGYDRLGKSEQRDGRAEEFEADLQTQGGGVVPVSVAMNEIVHDGTWYLLLVARDISERKRMAQRLAQAEKLAGMGRMTASIAHEVNNPLQALQSSLNLLVDRPMSEEKRAQILRMAHEQVGQLVGIVQHMMDLYRPMREGMRPVSPHEMLEAVLSLLGPRLEEHNITVQRDLEDYLPRVRGVSSQLKQVFASLVLNGIDAMPDGGTLTIRTYHHNQLVNIEIADTGKGIPPEDLKSIFEPFYSTRSERTGLSLAVSYGIVEQHEGTLTVRSGPEGAAFCVTLPAITSETGSNKATTS